MIIIWTVVTEALDLLSSAGAAVTGKQVDTPTPCTDWTVTQVLQHAAGDQRAWAAAVGTGADLIAPGAARTDPGRNPAEVS